MSGRKITGAMLGLGRDAAVFGRTVEATVTLDRVPDDDQLESLAGEPGIVTFKADGRATHSGPISFDSPTPRCDQLGPVTAKPYRTEYSIGWDIYEGATLIGFAQITRNGRSVLAVRHALGKGAGRRRRRLLIDAWVSRWREWDEFVLDGVTIAPWRIRAFTDCPHVP